MARVFEAFESRVGTLKGNDRPLARRIIRAVDAAQRVAARITNAEGRLPYRGEIPVLPGTRTDHTGMYTYTVIVIDPNGLGGRESTTPVVFTSDRILSIDAVQAQALRTLGRGEVADQYQSRVPGLMREQDLEYRLISVYRGLLHVG